MTKLLIALFEATNRIPTKLGAICSFFQKKHKLFCAILSIIFVCMMILAIMHITLAYIFLIILFVFIYAKFLLKSLISLKYFILESFLLPLFLTILFSVAFEPFILNYIWQYILFCFLFLICWVFLSLIADNKIATLSNEIYSIIYAIVVLIKNSIIEVIEYLINIDVSPKIEFALNIFLIPLLIVNSIATLFCLLKGYWIEKSKNKENEK